MFPNLRRSYVEVNLSLVRSLNFQGSDKTQSQSPILAFGDSNNSVFIAKISDQSSFVRYKKSDSTSKSGLE
jgi:hypothetical protein